MYVNRDADLPDLMKPDVSGYIYLSDDEAFDMIAEPSKYWSDVGEGPLFSQIYELGGQWMFVRTY